MIDGGGPGAYAADRLLVTNGSQQLLYITVEALCDPGDIVIVEDPTYLRIPWITSLNFKKEPDGSKWDPTPCSVK